MNKQTADVKSETAGGGDKLEAVMRFVYAHFLEENESLKDFLLSRAGYRCNIRHMVRKKIYHAFNCTYKEIAQAEGRCNGWYRPGLSTISDSVNKPVDGFESYSMASRVINNLLLDFDDYYLRMQNVEVNSRLAHYFDMKHHVLAVMVCFAEQFGWVQAKRLDGLYDEFRTVRKDFVEAEINK